jgi:hypothetical protein
MPQNMNTFSDLQATELALDLELQIRPVGQPRLCVSVNTEIVYTGILTQFITIRRQCPLLDPILIKIELVEKDYNAAQETAAVIEQLRIDDFELMPKWTQLAQYHNDHSYSQPTNYLGFVGTWMWSTDQPFYQWQHTVTGQGLLLKLDQ